MKVKILIECPGVDAGVFQHVVDTLIIERERILEPWDSVLTEDIPVSVINELEESDILLSYQLVVGLRDFQMYKNLNSPLLAYLYTKLCSLNLDPEALVGISYMPRHIEFIYKV